MLPECLKCQSHGCIHATNVLCSWAQRRSGAYDISFTFMVGPDAFGDVRGQASLSRAVLMSCLPS